MQKWRRPRRAGKRSQAASRVASEQGVFPSLFGLSRHERCGGAEERGAIAAPGPRPRRPCARAYVAPPAKKEGLDEELLGNGRLATRRAADARTHAACAGAARASRATSAAPHAASAKGDAPSWTQWRRQPGRAARRRSEEQVLRHRRALSIVPGGAPRASRRRTPRAAAAAKHVAPAPGLRPPSSGNRCLASSTCRRLSPPPQSHALRGSASAPDPPGGPPALVAC